MSVIDIDWRRIQPDLLRVVRNSFPDYNGRTLKVVTTEKVELLGAYWDGGSKSTYVKYDLATGQVSTADPRIANPPGAGGPQRVPEVQLRPNEVVVEHRISCGKDMGLTVHAHPSAVTPLLPPVVAITNDERQVLHAFQSLKAGPYRKEALEMIPNWGQLIEQLVARGLLKRSGTGVTITADGRNAQR